MNRRKKTISIGIQEVWMAFCFVCAVLGNTAMASDSNVRNTSEVLSGDTTKFGHPHLNSCLKGRVHILTYSSLLYGFPYFFLSDKTTENTLQNQCPNHTPPASHLTTILVSLLLTQNLWGSSQPQHCQVSVWQ